jgi:hypothetical protein
MKHLDAAIHAGFVSGTHLVLKPLGYIPDIHQTRKRLAVVRSQTTVQDSSSWWREFSGVLRGVERVFDMMRQRVRRVWWLGRNHVVVGEKEGG